MALFGKSTKAPLTPEERQAKADRWALIGATLQDVGGGLGGGDMGAVARTQKGITARTEKAMSKAATDKLIQQMLDANVGSARKPMQTMGNSTFGAPDLVSAQGPQAQPAGPQGMDPRALLEAQRDGVNVGGYMDILKALQPEGPTKLGANEVLVDQRTGKPVYINRAQSENDYTLSPGSIRFGPDGKPVANAPFAPQIVTASPESNVFTVDKNPPGPVLGNFDVASIDRLIGSTGGQITSGARTPERNAQVGGVANSYHLTGQARDVRPPPGVNTTQYAQTLKGQLPGMDVIDEGDHVHIEPGRRAAGGGMQVLQRGQPKATNEWVPESVNGVNILVNKKTGDRKADPSSPTTKSAKLSADQIGRFSLLVPSALAAVKRLKELEDGGYSLNKDAIAARTVAGDKPGGIVGGIARSMAGQDYQDYSQAAKTFESAVLPILSGAAVTESEAERLVTAALPQIGDTPQTAKVKAKSRDNMARAAEILLRGGSAQDVANLLIPADIMAAADSKPKATKAGPVRVSSPAAAAKLAPGTRFIGHDGVERVRQ
jgi:hypothetical protein